MFFKSAFDEKQEIEQNHFSGTFYSIFILVIYVLLRVRLMKN